MKIEMYEKVGEIVIAELRTAEENKEIAKKVNELKAEEERKREEERKQREQKRAEELLPIIVEKINNTALSGENCIEFTWFDNTKTEITCYDWKIFRKNYQKYFEGLGYKIYDHYYSDSWRKKSGKIGYGVIYW